MNVMLPEGVPEPEEGVTPAVKVTLAPGLTVAALALSAVVVERMVTLTIVPPELLAPLLESPP